MDSSNREVRIEATHSIPLEIRQDSDSSGGICRQTVSSVTGFGRRGTDREPPCLTAARSCPPCCREAPTSGRPETNARRRRVTMRASHRAAPYPTARRARSSPPVVETNSSLSAETNLWPFRSDAATQNTSSTRHEQRAPRCCAGAETVATRPAPGRRDESRRGDSCRAMRDGRMPGRVSPAAAGFLAPGSSLTSLLQLRL